MKYSARILRWPILWLAASVMAAPPTISPAFGNEQLHYNIDWPSGLALGEATLSESGSQFQSGPNTYSRLHLQFDLDAAVPGFTVSDYYDAQAAGDFCSSEFSRSTTHGARKAADTTTFDPRTATAIRQTAAGSRTQMPASECSRDALTFLYYVRRELSEGRVPPPQTIFLGAPYEVRLDFAGTENIRIGDRPVEADRVTASVKGPASSTNIDIFFLKDRARTPALVRVPLALGSFSMELVK